MFNPDLLTPSERQEILDLCVSIQTQCADILKLTAQQDAAIEKVLIQIHEVQ